MGARENSRSRLYRVFNPREVGATVRDVENRMWRDHKGSKSSKSTKFNDHQKEIINFTTLYLF